MATIDVTGAQLLEALEAATYATPEALGAFPQVSGIEFTVDTSSPLRARRAVYRLYLLCPCLSRQPGDHHRPSTASPLIPEATYTIATNDFTAKGGDTFGVFKAVGGWKDVGVPWRTP